MSKPSKGARKKNIVMERTFKASVDDVWDLWTTKEGIESWWGPEGFTVKVRKLDLRPDGELLYDMTAVAPQMIKFMENAGLPLTTEAHVTYTEIVPKQRLAYIHHTDFIPGVEPYGVATLIELHVSGGTVRMVLTFDAMHNKEWTDRAVMGWESELGRLETIIKARGKTRAEKKR